MFKNLIRVFLFSFVSILTASSAFAARATDAPQEPQFGGEISSSEMTDLGKWCRTLPEIDIDHSMWNRWKGCVVLAGATVPGYDHSVESCWEGNLPGHEPIVVSCGARCGGSAITWTAYSWNNDGKTKLNACVFCECLNLVQDHSGVPPVDKSKLTGLDPTR